jgi:uncharacterized coiled-coil protein SlyX
VIRLGALPVLAGCLFSVGCGGSERAELERRIAELETRLAEEVELADAVAELRQVHEVAAATALLHQVDLQGLTIKLAGEEPIRAVEVTAIEGAARVMKHADWPPALITEAENVAGSLDALAKALGGRDREKAAALAPPAYAYQLEMRQVTDRWLQAVAPWKRTTRPPHSHDADSGHMDHDPRHQGIVGMWGDVHVEARLDRDGRVHCWLTGPTRDPISSAGVRGEVVLYPDTDRQLRMPLMIGGDDFLMGRTKPPVDDSVHVLVRLEGTSEGGIEMDFALPVRDVAGR